MKSLFLLMITTQFLYLLQFHIYRDTETEKTACLDLAILKARELCEINSKLIEYSRTHHTYPVYGWVARLNPDNTMNLGWPAALAIISNEQYYYKSNGIHYKLISALPDDCNLVKKHYPWLVTPTADCDSYGYWSLGAAYW